MDPEKPVGGTLLVRLKEAYADTPAIGVTVLLCTGSNNDRTIVARGTSTGSGVVALAHNLTPDTDCVLVIETPGWSLAGFVPERTVEFSLGNKLELKLITETPSLPDNYLSLVDGLLSKLHEIRILVLQGMHYGCQAAVYELIRNLRRLGYRGPITVMSDEKPLLYHAKYELQIVCAQANPQAHSQAVLHFLQQRYQDGVVKLVKTFAKDDKQEQVFQVELLKHTAFEEDPLTLPTQVKEGLGFAEEVQVSGYGFDKSSVIRRRTVESRPIVDIDLTITSISEISLVAKLKFLEPHHEKIFKNVEWCTGTAFEPTNDPWVLGMLAGGEYTINVDDGISRALGTKLVLGLQPSNWKLHDRYVRRFTELKPLGELTLLHLPFASTYLTDPVDMPSELPVGVHELVTAASSGQIDLMFVYGIHQTQGLSTGQLMSNVDKIVRRASKKPLVVFTIYKYQLEGFDQKMVSLKDLPHLLTGVQVGSPLYVHDTGPLPESAFRLICQSSTLPAIVGGANTSNLVRMLGKPHLSVEGGEPFHVPEHQGDTALARLEKLLRSKDLDEESLDQLVEFTIAAIKEPDQALDGYFALLKKWLRQPGRDQLLLGLLRLSVLLER